MGVNTSQVQRKTKAGHWRRKAMKEIALPYETPRIKINGMVFDLQMSEYDVVCLAISAIENYQSRVDRDATTEEILTGFSELNGMIDAILGQGTVDKLADGRPVGLKLITSWLTSILKAISEEFIEHAVQ